MVNTRSRENSINGGMLLVGILFLAFALYFAYGIYQSYGQQRDAAAHYQPVAARILDSKVDQRNLSTPGSTGPHRVYTPFITYEYTVDGRRYRSNRFSHLGPSLNGREDAQAIVDRHAPGSTQTAYYNPSNPAQAVLHRAAPAGYAPMLIAGLFVLLGGLAVIGGWRGWLRDFK